MVLALQEARNFALRFNGAAPARARNGNHCPCAPLVGRASTGPRPRGRGMVGIFDGTQIRREASTGPRPRGRGMWLRADMHRSNARSFNGAAPARARNGVMQLFASSSGGRASTGPRPGGRGMYNLAKLSTQGTGLLQRGRARAGAEW